MFVRLNKMSYNWPWYHTPHIGSCVITPLYELYLGCYLWRSGQTPTVLSSRIHLRNFTTLQVPTFTQTLVLSPDSTFSRGEMVCFTLLGNLKPYKCFYQLYTKAQGFSVCENVLLLLIINRSFFYVWLHHMSHMTVTGQSHDSHGTVTWQSHDSHMTWYAPADWPRHCVPLHTQQRTLQCHQKWAAEQRTTQKSQTSTSIVSPIENERERCTIHLRTKPPLNGKLDSSMYNCCMQIVSLLQAGKTRGWLWDPLQRREIRGRLNLCVGTHTREWRVCAHGAQTGWSWWWDYSSSLQQPLALFPDLPHLQLQANLMKLHALTQVTRPMHSWNY